MSREVAEACEKINWAGVEEVGNCHLLVVSNIIDSHFGFGSPNHPVLSTKIYLSNLSGDCGSATMDPGGWYLESKGFGQAFRGCPGHCHAGLTSLVLKFSFS